MILKTTIEALLFIISAFFGSIYHWVQNAGGGWLVGGTVYYKYNYGSVVEYDWGTMLSLFQWTILAPTVAVIVFDTLWLLVESCIQKRRFSWRKSILRSRGSIVLWCVYVFATVFGLLWNITG